MRAHLIGHLDKFVGGLAHRRNDRHDTMTTAMQIGETARDRADFCRGFKTGAAVFLHDDGIVAHSTNRNTLRAAWMPARTNCGTRGCKLFRKYECDGCARPICSESLLAAPFP